MNYSIINLALIFGLSQYPYPFVKIAHDYTLPLFQIVSLRTLLIKTVALSSIVSCCCVDPKDPKYDQRLNSALLV